MSDKIIRMPVISAKAYLGKCYPELKSKLEELSMRTDVCDAMEAFAVEICNQINEKRNEILH